MAVTIPAQGTGTTEPDVATRQRSDSSHVQIVETRDPLVTPASPSAASVGVASGSVLAANSNRKGLVLVNTSLNRISLGLGAAAVLDSGITLNPVGGTWVMDEYTFTTVEIFAIASGGGSNLAIQEFSVA